MNALYPRAFQPVQRGDYFAGWLHYGTVGFGLENNSGGSVYYYYRDLIEDICETVDFKPEKRVKIDEGLEYWRFHATMDRSAEPGAMMFAMSKESRHGSRVSKELWITSSPVT
ncbi:MAG: hypothetical protein LBS62_04910 [Clostridiales bacterium]|jgi:hypothetical protein|nr:hypothetical protein [Clostridiales bacterium]